ncbi:hypothetical protein [Rufibacter hautae]|uniref:Uncharacterized protein n=1 Tax=Rufibacter hautae TaxID=2595005 RepID=A0A5B6TMW9_9BACT|nr:hypothetical protein [Rufibacter hautae]KAA3440695.1 hypothetical protein FOA19_08620 [Rufibacter hautae]
MPALEKDLRQAVLGLPAARKDKLLLQLLSSQPVLQDQLKFELLEGEEGLELRREALAAQIQTVAQGFYYNATDLLICLRTLCPPLSYHAKITNDVYGEINLLLQLLQEVLTHQKEMLQVLTGGTEALGLFLAKRAEEMLQKLNKLHEDLHVEFADAVNEVLPKLHASAAGYAARKQGVPVQWK